MAQHYEGDRSQRGGRGQGDRDSLHAQFEGDRGGERWRADEHWGGPYRPADRGRGWRDRGPDWTPRGRDEPTGWTSSEQWTGSDQQGGPGGWYGHGNYGGGGQRDLRTDRQTPDYRGWSQGYGGGQGGYAGGNVPLSGAGPGDYGGQGGQGTQLNFTGSTYAGGQGSHVGRGDFTAGRGAQGPFGELGSFGGGWSGHHAGVQGRTPRGRAPKNYRRSDERLQEEICERLMHDPELDVSDVSVQVQDGRVCLEGTVRDRRMKHAIEDLVDRSLGVVDIDNRVRVGAPEHRAEPEGGSERKPEGKTSESSGSTTASRTMGR